MSKNNNSNSESKSGSISKQVLLTLLGSIPTIVICIVCAVMFHHDYALNRNTFFGQSKFFSMIEKFEYYENVTCAPGEYDTQGFVSCAPKYCARYFTDKVVSDEEVNILFKMAKSVLDNAESNSYYDFFTNKVYAQSLSDKSEISENRKQFTQSQIETKNEIVNKIISDIKKRLNINGLKPFYSQHFQKIKKTIVNNYKAQHQIDKRLNEAIYYTATVYLNDHQIDYYGGRFILDDYNKATFLSVEPKKARLFVYTSGSENKNEIEEVFKGERYSFTVYFTCDN